ncbi:MAG TPA: hypothetical protein VNG32_00425 [Candidatus Dormibacteraeota bacterium]|nr:hypothetical protein [Candidatus Dormibacteraeota bacterium]
MGHPLADAMYDHDDIQGQENVVHEQQERNIHQEILQNLFVKHTDLHKLYIQDPTVHSWLRMYEIAQCTIEEAFIGIAVHLAREKKTYFDMALKAQSLQVPTPVLLPHNAKFLDTDESGGRPIKMPKLEKGSRIGLTNFGGLDGSYVVTKVKGDKFSMEKEK